MKAGLDGGTFGFTIPYHLNGWLSFILGLLLAFGSIIAMLLSEITWLGFVAAFGFVVALAGSPTPVQKTIRRLRIQANRTRLAKTLDDQRATDFSSFWSGEYVRSRGESSRDWVLPAPSEEAWNLSDVHAPDTTGVIPEHPAKVGTPQPSTLTNWTLFLVPAAILVMLDISKMTRMGLLKPLLSWLGFSFLSLAWLVMGWFANRRAREMKDVPTSTVRSAAVGSLELVGQVRPQVQPPTVIVDRDPAKSIPDLVLWNWVYEVKVCWEETYTDSEGRTRTRQKCEWRRKRGNRGSMDFILHDGTGGALVRADTFSRLDLDDPLRVWQCTHSPRARDLLFELFTQGDVRAHRWTLKGIQLDDPVYLQGVAQSRTDADLDHHGIDRTVAHALLEIVGEDGVANHARLERGTELSALAGSRSAIEFLIIPLIFSLIGVFFAFSP